MRCNSASISPAMRSMSAAEIGRLAQATRMPPNSFSRENSSRVPSFLMSNGVARIGRS